MNMCIAKESFSLKSSLLRKNFYNSETLNLYRLLYKGRKDGMSFRKKFFKYQNDVLFSD